MLRIIVACLIVNINSSLAIENKDQNKYNIFLQNYGTNDQDQYHFYDTKHSANGKDRKVIIQLLTERPLTKIYNKVLDTEKLSLGLVNRFKAAAEKESDEWSAFRRWKENGEDIPTTTKAQNPKSTSKTTMKMLATETLTVQKNNTHKPAVIHSNVKIVKKTPKSHSTSKAITKQASVKTTTEKPVIEWSALRRLKENVDDKYSAIKSQTDHIDFNCLLRNAVEKALTEQPPNTIARKKIKMENTELGDHSPFGTKTNSETTLLKNLTTQEVITEKATTKQLGVYHDSERVIEESRTEIPLEKYLSTKKKKAIKNISQKKVKPTMSTTRKATKEEQQFLKLLEKLLTEKKNRNKLISKKAAAIKRAAPEKPSQLCWDGQGVQQMVLRQKVLDGRKVRKNKSGNGKIIYRTVNNKKIPAWSMIVKGNRKATTKKDIRKKHGNKKGKAMTNNTKKTGPNKVANKTNKKKGKVKDRKMTPQTTKGKKATCKIIKKVTKIK